MRNRSSRLATCSPTMSRSSTAARVQIDALIARVESKPPAIGRALRAAPPKPSWRMVWPEPGSGSRARSDRRGSLQSGCRLTLFRPTGAMSFAKATWRLPGAGRGVASWPSCHGCEDRVVPPPGGPWRAGLARPRTPAPAARRLWIRARVPIAARRRPVRHRVRLGAHPGVAPALPDRPGGRTPPGGARLRGDDRRRPGPDGSGQPRGQGSRRPIDRLQHPPARRAAAESVRGPIDHLSALLRPQSAPLPPCVRVRRAPRRRRHDGRGVRGAGARPDREDRAGADHPDRDRGTGARSASCSNRWWRTPRSTCRTWSW